MDDTEATSLEQIRAFLAGSGEVRFAGQKRDEVYAWTERILEREHSEYGQAVYVRLAGISVAQIYRFRSAEAYRRKNTTYQPTRPTPIPIGERRKPRPKGRPGYLRIDTVHQGDQDGAK